MLRCSNLIIATSAFGFIACLYIFGMSATPVAKYASGAKYGALEAMLAPRLRGALTFLLNHLI